MANQPIFNGEELVRRLAEAGQAVRFGSGVLGKTSYAVIVLLILWAIIIWRLGDNAALNATLFAAGFVASGVFLWWLRATHRFAENNPAQAMLDGAEFTAYKRFEAEVKGGPTPTLSDARPTLVIEQVPKFDG